MCAAVVLLVKPEKTISPVSVCAIVSSTSPALPVPGELVGGTSLKGLRLTKKLISAACAGRATTNAATPNIDPHDRFIECSFRAALGMDAASRTRAAPEVDML